MKHRKSFAIASTLTFVALGLLVFACDVNDEEAGVAPKPGTGSPDATLGADAVVMGEGGTPKIPGLCGKVGGPTAVSTMAQTIFANARADCRIGIYFTNLDAQRTIHVRECMIKQLSAIFSCPDYDYSTAKASDGEDCRSMDQAHNNLTGAEGKQGLNNNDYVAYVQVTQGVLKAAKMTDTDIEGVLSAFNQLKNQVAPRTTGDTANTYCTCPNNQFNGTSCVPPGGYVLPEAGPDTGPLPDTGTPDTATDPDTSTPVDAANDVTPE